MLCDRFLCMMRPECECMTPASEIHLQFLVKSSVWARIVLWRNFHTFKFIIFTKSGIFCLLKNNKNNITKDLVYKVFDITRIFYVTIEDALFTNIIFLVLLYSVICFGR